ncbi:MAG: GTPase Era [bacterium]
MAGKRKKPPPEEGRTLDLARILADGEEEAPPPLPGHRSGFAAVIGRPNVGKSTLLNRILGQKLAIISRKPGTTRRRLLGVYTRPEVQAVFYDTPGLERPATKLGRFLLEEVKAAAVGADIALFMTDGREEKEDIQALSLLEESAAPVFLLINKVDLMERSKLLPMIERYSGAGRFEEIIPLSALKGEGVDGLMKTLTARLPEGPRYFPPHIVTDASERSLVEEFVREQVYLQLHREVPYAAAVQVTEMERDPDSDLLHITADIYVERKSQRGIVIGKGGKRIKALGQASREEIEKRLGEPIFLGLQVRVKPNWRQRDAALQELGYERE